MPASQASRATASDTGSSKPALSQASSQSRSASSSAATVIRSRSSVGAKNSSISARARSAHCAGVAGVDAVVHQRVNDSTTVASDPAIEASRPPTSP